MVWILFGLAVAYLLLKGVQQNRQPPIEGTITIRGVILEPRGSGVPQPKTEPELPVEAIADRNAQSWTGNVIQLPIRRNAA